MCVPYRNPHPTPLNERLRYLLMVVIFLVTPLFLLIFGGLFMLFDSDLPPSPYGSNPVYKIDYEFCLEIRPAEELKDCLRGYGWFDPPVKDKGGR